MKTFLLLLAALPVVWAQSQTVSSTDFAAATTTEHDDHSITATASCEAHGDHWHCPSGVSEPTTPPAVDTASEDHHHDHDHSITATASCEGHGDHWHCPSGVSEPTTPPPQSAQGSPTTAASSQSTGAAAVSKNGNMAAVMGVIGLGALLV
ncbi:hypothetical protein EJ04DRAFT_568743 [Polyplosphaeria fusca]|uniref:Uncharacterized protein n=1 Tax=Polyplosphaeria fusca TaxID=682080 RepID=A0A9P4QPZ1_9PLEO|nr:hypothetical protein EJ04DRAFT_568743 [Polyplosphaeria fusca]